MADAKITALTENTTPVGTDLVHIIDDPAGTPLNQKITLTNLTATWFGNVDGGGYNLDNVARIDLTNIGMRNKIQLINSTNFTIGYDPSVTFGGLSTEAMEFTSANASGEGFWWGDTAHTDAQGAMALTSDGHLTVAGKARFGFGESDTTTPATWELEVNGTLRADELKFGNTGNGIINLSGSDIIINAAAGDVAIRGGGENLFRGTVNGSAALYYDNVKRLETGASGVAVLYSNGNTDTEERRLSLQHANGTQRGYVGFTVSNILYLRNEIHGAPIHLIAEDNTGGARILFNGDPDGAANIYYNGTTTARTATAATGGLEANNTETGTGWERVLTESDGERVFAKTATQNVANTTFTDDTHITGVTLEADTYYWLELLLDPYPGGTSNSSIKWKMVFSDTLQKDYGNGWRSTFTGPGYTPTWRVAIWASGDILDPVVWNASNLIRHEGLIRTNATTGGTMKLQWAKNATSTWDIILDRGTHLKIRKLGA